MKSRSMELFRRGRLLLLSGALAVGGLAGAAATAHAVSPTVTVAPANATVCPVLTLSGSNFVTKNAYLEIHLYRNLSYVTTFATWTDGSGNTPKVTYPNHFSGAGRFSAYAVDSTTRQVVWSQSTLSCVQ